jgi:gamma-glutamylcyclotransferase (GGCT)/AIG2-like uncharacterized protein YtfP
MANYLFVYGTLLQPGNTFAAYLKAHCTFYAEGSFKGLLYNIGEYPGALLLPYGDDRVYGNIYLLNDADEVLKVLDDYEGFGDAHPQPNEFIRKQVIVDANDASLTCWIYLYNWDVKGLKQMESGRYKV